MLDAQRVGLQDGRQLGFAAFGDPDGVPCLSFHGIPGSRFEGAFFHEAALAQGIRLIALDRPGMGLSSPAPGRSVASLTRDVEQLADALGLERFGVLGWSGGGPYALACAALLADRVPVTVAASVPTPGTAASPTWRQMSGLRRQVWRLGTRRSWPLVPVVWSMGHAVHALAPLVRRAAARNPSPSAPPAEVVRGMHEPWRQGARYVAQDVHVATQDWGFGLSQVQGEVHLWHGLDDTVVPVAMGRALAEQLPGCRPHLVPGGHRLCVERAADVLVPLRPVEAG